MLDDQLFIGGDIDEAEMLIAFPKKKEIGQNGSHPIYEDLNPPRFYNKMRNKAVIEGKVKVQGDEAPPLGDRRLL